MRFFITDISCIFTPRRHQAETRRSVLALGAQYPAAPLPAAPTLPGARPLPRPPLFTMPRVYLASRHQFFTGAHKRPTRPFDFDACNYMLGALTRAVLDRVARRITLAAMMYKMSAGQFDLVYNSLSFTLASMMASTLFFWLRLSAVHEKYKTAMTITGLVTFIAAYHYLRIFNSWVDAYEFPDVHEGYGDSISIQDPNPNPNP